MNPNAEAFRAEVLRLIHAAAQQGLRYVEIRAGDVHRNLGGVGNRQPTCCGAMRSLFQAGDSIVRLPADHPVNPNGVSFDEQAGENNFQGANLVICYQTAGR